ncbi:MAG TPA: hypothetical protein VGE04_01045 [Chloroflexia bacterium]
MDDTAQPPQVGLSPPWNTLWSKINSTIGADPSFKVQPLQDDGNGSYSVVITSQGGGSDPAALSAILTKSYTMGNITVRVNVQYTQQIVINVNSPESLAQAVRLGLRSNPYFVEAILTKPTPFYSQPSVVAVFTKSVIQFFNDDLSDYYHNFNGVTADVFHDVLVLDYGNKVTLGTTTQSSRSEEGGAEDGGGAADGGAEDGGAGDGGVTPDGGKV